MFGKFIVYIFCFLALALSAESIVLKNIIVQSDRSEQTEVRAVEELRLFLGKATGTEFQVMKESDWDGAGPVIVCGRTAYAAKHLAEAKDLVAEEWLLAATADRNLIITGGVPRGTLYGAYEFLEKYAGCRFLAVKANYIPKLDSITVPAELRERGKPFFRYRLMSLGIQAAEHDEFYARNRIQGPRQVPAAWGGWYMFGSPNRCHTFGIYSQSFPKDRPELYSLNAAGARLIARDGMGPGQLCLSHPEVRKLMKQKLREYIRLDREKADKENKPYPEIYDISQNDNYDCCLCAGCKALEKKYGNQTGVLLDFINDIAADIGKDFPEIKIQTFAYMYTEDIPQAIAPRENVLIQLALLGKDLRQYRDTMRSIHHPNNARAKKTFTDWAGISPRLATWDYGKIWEERFPTPYTFVRGQEENLRFYAENKVQSIYMETELWGPGIGPIRTEIQNFCDLKNYQFARLMMDPYAGSEAIIDDFMEHYYGAAAGTMKEWLNYLERRQAEEPNYLGGDIIARRRYLNREFFVTTEQMLGRAEELVANEPELLARVRQERFMVDYCMLNLWDQLFKQEAFPLEREKVVSRLVKNQDHIRARYFENPDGSMLNPWLGNFRENDAVRIAAFSFPVVPLPEKFRNMKIAADFPWTKMQERRVERLCDDPDAMGGRAMRIAEIPDTSETHSKPFEIGIYDTIAKKILTQKIYPVKDLPKDEKYHWYVLNGITLAAKCRMWSHWTWSLSPAPIDDAFSMAAPFKKYDIYFSIKFEGPSYVPGSAKKDAVWMDRVVVVDSQ